MNRTTSIAALAALLLVAACDTQATPEPETSIRRPPASVAIPKPVPTVLPGASVAPPKAPAKPQPPTAAVKFTGFSTPESVLYDGDADRYLVSNVDGNPGDADGKGFISELTPDGGIKTLKWIEGGQKKVTLNAPKGMAIVKGVLYVADLDVVRMFDAKTGAPKGNIKLEGATFANDVAASPEGKIYVSDTGLKQDGKDLKPTGTDAVWIIENGKAKSLAKSTDLGRPNGLLVDGKLVWVVTYGSGEMYQLDEKGQKSSVAKPPKGTLDGLINANGRILLSSWDGEAIYEKKGNAFVPLLEQLSAPADIGFDSKRSRILVPRFTSDTVEAYDLPK